MLAFSNIIVEFLQISFCRPQVLPFAPPSVEHHAVSLVVVDKLVIGGDEAESIGHSKESEMRSMRIEEILTEGELFVRQAQLCQKRGGDVLLTSNNIYALRFSNSSSCQNERNTIAVDVKIANMRGIAPEMVGNKDNERILPCRQRSEVAKKISDNTISVGKGIEALVA